MSENQTSRTPEIQGWLQIATSSGFTGLAFYLIVIVLPNMQDKFDAHSNKAFDRFETQMQQQRSHSETVIQGITDRYESQLDRLIMKVDTKP